MDRANCRSHGQAIVELTIVIVTILLLVSVAIALTATLRKELKHNFIKDDSNQVSNLPEKMDGLKNFIRFFPKEARETTLLKLRQSGWNEDRRLKIPGGLVILLNSPIGHMGLIETGKGKIGVYYK